MATRMSDRGRSIALVVIALALTMDIIDLTIVNVAIPTIQAQLGAGKAAVQWMVAGYATAFATLLMTGGRLGDIYGYRRMLLIGATGFTAASLLCGLAPDGVSLVVARLTQGMAAAMMVPQIMSLVQILYPPHERAGALGIFGVLGGAAAVGGPIIGGVLIGADLFGLGWRPIFLVNVPVGLLILGVAPAVLPATRSHLAPRIDAAGVGLMSLAAFALLFPMIEGRALGWPGWMFALPPVAALLLAALVIRSRRLEQAGRSSLLPFSLLQNPTLRWGLPLGLIFQAATASLLFVLSILLQEDAGFSSIEVAIAHIPYAIGASIAIGVVARNLLPRFGAQLIFWGCLAMIIGIAALAALLEAVGVAGLTVAILSPVMLVLGLGMGSAGGAMMPVLLADVPIGFAGAASGLLKTVQELGGALGVAVVGSAYFALDGANRAAAQMAATGLIALCLVAAGGLTLRLVRHRTPD
jgi:EmrB/QacA subfamily drug resistance transporter